MKYFFSCFSRGFFYGIGRILAYLTIIGIIGIIASKGGFIAWIKSIAETLLC